MTASASLTRNQIRAAAAAAGWPRRTPRPGALCDWDCYTKGGCCAYVNFNAAGQYCGAQWAEARADGSKRTHIVEAVEELIGWLESH